MNKNIISTNYSLIEKKIFLGFSGLVLLTFIIGHLIGNMSIFVSQDAINSYAYFLHKNKLLVYSARIFLLFNLMIHLYFSISITYINNKAKQTDYAVKNNISATFMSRTMIYSGFVILIFLIYHLLHFTLGVIDPCIYLDNKERFDVYTMVYKGFSNGYISLIYIVSLLCLGLHLSHAFFSVCQTFSIISSAKMIKNTRFYSLVLSGIIVLSYIMIPISIFFQFIKY